MLTMDGKSIARRISMRLKKPLRKRVIVRALPL